MAVLHSDAVAIAALRRLHFLFCVRACASLAVNQNQAAGEDVLTSLHLARLARQLPDAESATRAQQMLVRSLQPLWEGLAEHRWNDAQLAEFQQQLAKFDPLGDYTNTVRRAVLAHIDVWRRYPDAKVPPHSVPMAGNAYLAVENAAVRPSAWWFDDCIQLHQIGERAIARVDAAAQIIHRNEDWNECDGLHLGHQTAEFLGQHQWWGASPVLLAFAQNALNQAIIACALERYRMVSNSYPETLEQLVPGCLNRVPADVVRGRPMIYERTDTGRYILRSVGPNEQDDRRSKTPDDWLWWYETNVPATVVPARN
jgi:hypothetical protein